MKPCYSEPFLSLLNDLMHIYLCIKRQRDKIWSDGFEDNSTNVSPPALEDYMWWEVACSAPAVFTIGRMCKPLPQLCMY